MPDLEVDIVANTGKWKEGFNQMRRDIRSLQQGAQSFQQGAGAIAGATGGTLSLNKFLSSDIAKSYESAQRLGIQDPKAPEILRHIDEAFVDSGFEGEGTAAQKAQALRRAGDAATMGDTGTAIALQRAGFDTSEEGLRMLQEAPHIALADRIGRGAYVPGIEESRQRQALDSLGLSEIHQGDRLGLQGRLIDRIDSAPTADAETARFLHDMGKDLSKFGNWVDRMGQGGQTTITIPSHLSDYLAREIYDDRYKHELRPNE